MKNIVKILCLAISVLLCALFVMSCGVDYTDEDIIKEAKALVEKSVPINVIYFGEGLPISAQDSEAAEKFAKENGFSLENIQFLPVNEESPYKKIEDIKKATEKVYSKAYCEYLFSMAFEGYSTEDGTAAVYAKYLEDESGTLTVRIDLADNPLPKRTYDFASCEVISKKDDKAMIKLDSYLDGVKEENKVTFTIVKEEDGWRLDTPTY